MTPTQIAEAQALVDELFDSDAASALTNRSARSISALIDALEAQTKRADNLAADFEALTQIKRNYAEMKDAAEAQVADLKAKLGAMTDRASDLAGSVVAFGAVWAVDHAKRAGFAPGELHPTHYDTLKDAGARMDDFRRAAIKSGGA